MLPKKPLFIAGVFSGIFSILFIGLVLISSLNSNNLNLTAEQKREILTQIVKNNSASLFNRESTSASGLATPSADASTRLMAPLVIRPDASKYNYRYSKIIYTNGPAIEQCKSYSYGNIVNYTNETYEFYGKDNSFYSKYISKDSNNDLLSYTLTQTNSEYSNTIEYRGGSYAIKTEYNFAESNKNNVDGSLPLTAPDNETLAPELQDSIPSDENNIPVIDEDSIIKQYFGADVDIINILNENEKTYFIIQYSYQTDCSQDYLIKPLDDIASSSSISKTENSLSDKIIVQNIVDSKTFEVIKNYNYIKEASNANLLSTYQTTTENMNTDFDKVSSNFKFDYNVEIKKVDYPEYNPLQDAENLVTYLRGQNIQILIPEDINFEFTSAYSNSAALEKLKNTNAYYDRKFYPAGAKGEEAYKSLVEPTANYSSSLLSLSYINNDNNNYDSVSIDIYNLNADNINHDSFAQISKIQLSIDGVNREATMYTYDYQTVVTEPSGKETSSGSSIAPVPPSVGYVIRQVELELNGFKYNISLPQRKDFDLNTLKFKTFSSSNTREMNQFASTIINSARNPNKVNGSGASSSGSAGTADPSPEPK